MNSIVKITALMLMVCAIGCKEEVTKPPSDLIPENEFVEILVELNLIEATRSMHTTKEQKLETHPSVFYRHLWQDHDITEAQFESSFEFYRMDLDNMALIYEKTAQILKRKEDEVNAKKRLSKEQEPMPQEVPE